MTYAEAIQFLQGLQRFGARFGLETTRQLAAGANHPERQLRFIHVAGTNGKGSTCAMLESIYRAAGYRPGLFTSPHLISFRERIQINRQFIPEAEVARLVALTARHCPGSETTFFEFVTVMALQYFAEQNCDLVIWETGLGGRLDATNIVTPIASVITNIGLDHQPWLGDTLAKIAAEKAGIIKPGVPVLTATDDPAALEVIRVAAQQCAAPLTVVTAGETGALRTRAALPLPGAHQMLNAALAVRTVETLRPQIAVPESAIRRGLETVEWAGRLQWITRPDGRRYLLDGAHNLPGVAALVAALREQALVPNATFILGLMQDKDWPAICPQLAPLARHIEVVALATERTAVPTELAHALVQANPAACVHVAASLDEALERVPADSPAIITGSLYLVGEALARLAAPADKTPAEHTLNQWRPASRAG
jgi:dihydrofolate synthase/folylpolyglutamate synthase